MDPPPPPYQTLPSGQARVQAQQQQQPRFNPPPGPPPPLSNNPFADPVGQVATSPTAYSQPPYHGQPPQRTNSVSQQAQMMSPDQSRMSTAGGMTPQISSVGRADSSSARQREDPLDMLAQFDTIIIVDDSGSMTLTQDDRPNGPSRWQEARDALAGVVYLAAQKDADGIEVHFLNSEQTLLNCTDPAAVKRLFDSLQPEGPTPTGSKIEMLLLEYLDEIENYKQKKAQGTATGKEPKKRNYIIITDGAPTDDVESVIESIARRLDEGRFPLAQVGFSFIQVGDDPEATAALHELDDTLGGQAKVRDIVDTTPYSGMALNAELLTKAILGGINRRYDRKDRRASTLR